MASLAFLILLCLFAICVNGECSFNRTIDNINVRGTQDFLIKNPSKVLIQQTLVSSSSDEWSFIVWAESLDRLSQVDVSILESDSDPDSIEITITDSNPTASHSSSLSSSIFTICFSIVFASLFFRFTIPSSPSSSSSSSFLSFLSLISLIGLGIFVFISNSQPMGCEDVVVEIIRPSVPSRLPPCSSVGGSSPVQAPEWVTWLTGQTSWFASPIVVDLDIPKDGHNELVACYYDCYIFSSNYTLMADTESISNDGRTYSGAVVADLEKDGITDICHSRGHRVWCYEWLGTNSQERLRLKSGFPTDTTSSGQEPEIRGMSAADLDLDGTIEIVVTTTQTERDGAQVFAFDSNGNLFQPNSASQHHTPAWPRYNTLSGQGNDADFNGCGHHGYGAFGLNVAIGNVDDDPELEIIATYDNHHIQVFQNDGVALDTSPYFRNRADDCEDQRMTWGQFIRWAEPDVERDHYHFHNGTWPHPDNQEWLQWTATPPNVFDLDLDGKSEVIGAPNIEFHTPYETMAYGLFILQGNHEGGDVAGLRKPGWEQLRRGNYPIKNEAGDWYPPGGIPIITIADILDGNYPEIIVNHAFIGLTNGLSQVPLVDGYIRCYDWQGNELWRYDFVQNRGIDGTLHATEVTIADLNGDGSPELVFGTWGEPDGSTNGDCSQCINSGWLIILDAQGNELHSTQYPCSHWSCRNDDNGCPATGCRNGNGNGIPAAPGIGDLNGDGELEIFVQTFETGMNVFRIPGSSTNCLLWPTGRGGALRKGQPDGYSI